jgi:TP901 family phage tail tape measure protein
MTQGLEVALVLKAKDELSKVVDTATTHAVADFAKLQDQMKKLTETTARLSTQGFTPATRHLGDLSSGMGSTTTRMSELAQVFSSAASGALSAVVGRLESAGAGARNFATTLATGGPTVSAWAGRLHHASSELQELGAKSLAVGGVLGAALLKPIEAFAQYDEAVTRAKVAFQTASGLDPRFGEVAELAEKLGKELPGTTTDFTQMASALKEIGISTATIVGINGDGALTATAHLRTVLGNLGPEQAAHMMGTFKESLGIADKDFSKFVDMVQRTKFAFGVNPEQFSESVKYFGAIASRLGVSGLGAAKPLLAMTGILRQAGVEGSMAGTALESLFTHVADMDTITRKSKELKHILGGHSINLEFFKNGKFQGMENLMLQLDKLRVLSQQDQLKALKHLFGEQHISTIATLVGKGVEGYHQALDAMEKQASLATREKMIMGSLSMKWETATGNISNLLSKLGKSLEPELKEACDRLGDLADAATKWVAANPKLVHSVMLGVTALAGFTVAAGGALVVIGTLGHGLAFGLSGWALLAPRLIKVGAAMSGVWGWGARVGVMLLGLRFPVGMLQRFGAAFVGLRWNIALAVGVMRRWTAAQVAAFSSNFLNLAGLNRMALLFGGSLVNGIRAATLAVWGFSTSLLANPITWIVIVIAGAALLIYKYWKPISGFFKGLWQGIKEGFGPVATTLGPKLAKLAVLLKPVTDVLKSVWNWLKKLLNPVDDVGHHMEKTGLTWGKVIGKMLGVLVDAHVQMFSAGAALIGQLVKGIESATPLLKAAMHGVAGMVRDFWPHSPAKVGPLRDLHRTHIVEQIASAVTPAPLVSAMRRVAGTVVPTLKGGLGRSPMASAGAGSGGGHMTLNYAPTVTIGSGSAQDREDFGAILRRHRDEIASIVAEHRMTRARSSY